MKTKMLIALIALVILLGNTLKATPFASPIEKAGITIGAISKTLMVKVNTPQEETVLISIEDTEGVEFHAETVAIDKELIKRFNLKNLPAGQYLLVIKNKRSKTIQPFTLDNDNIAIANEKRELLPLPLVHLDGRMLKINVPAKKNETFSIKIYDNFGTTLVDKTYTEAGLQVYDLNKLASGAYFVEVDGEITTLDVQ